MAPYTMKIEVVNATEYDFTWIGISTIKNPDRSTSTDNGSNFAAGRKIVTPISKSGGTDGMFSPVSWYTGKHGRGSEKTAFSVYCEMAASSGSTVLVRLKNTFHWMDQLLQTSLATDEFYTKRADTSYFSSAFGMNGITVSLEPTSLGYPDSHVYIVITQDIPIPQIPSKMYVYEGKRVRTSDGTIYLVLDGKLRHIANMTVLQRLFGIRATGLSGVARGDISINDAVGNAMPKGTAITADLPLITPPGGGPIYLVDDGRKRYISSPETFNHYAFDWGQVTTLDTGRFEDGAVIKIEIARDGTLKLPNRPFVPTKNNWLTL